jgi:hypothetical protein
MQVVDAAVGIQTEQGTQLPRPAQKPSRDHAERRCFLFLFLKGWIVSERQNFEHVWLSTGTTLSPGL